MLKASSLLYAIYVCLVMALLCCGLLYMSNLFTMLNQFYTDSQELYINNQSVVNFAVKNLEQSVVLTEEENNGIKAEYYIKQHGIIPVLVTKSFTERDTVTSAHFIGNSNRNNTALYLARYGRGLSYAGNVTLSGKSYLPSLLVNTVYINGKSNSLLNKEIELSDDKLPEPTEIIKSGFGRASGVVKLIKDISNKDSLYYNSFLNSPIIILYNENRLTDVKLGGNIIIQSEDSISVSASAHLDDVIIIAPKINFEEGFIGTVQAFALDGISLEKNVQLIFPSVLYCNSSQHGKSEISINEGSAVTGIIIMYGNEYKDAEYKNIVIENTVSIVGDIYCSGTLCLKSDVKGAVYTNRLTYKTNVAAYTSSLVDISILPDKVPDYFYNIPMFKESAYATIKKVF